MHNEHEDVISDKVMKELTRRPGVVYLATTYISPNGNKDTIIKTLETLGEEIIYFLRKGKVIIQGDLNAHISNKGDIIIPDKFDQDFPFATYHTGIQKTPRKQI